MRRGRMDYRIKVFRPVTLPDVFGGDEYVEWEEAGTWWAQRQSLTGRAVDEQSEIFHDYTARFDIDYNHKPEEGWRVEADGVLYSIDSILPNRPRGLKTLICNRVNL